MQWLAKAPSNIALIKYMGKEDSELNLPKNPSLSYTLPHLISTVTLETTHVKDYWEPLTPEFSLSLKAQQRFLEHLQRLKSIFSYEGNFIVRSCNNFPQGTGLASSASSFAALTLCAVQALSELKNLPLPTIEEQAKLSRLGSGSSCRSLFSPWAIWDGEEVAAISFPYEDLIHQVILISAAEKQISSSLAHSTVKTSPLYPTRAARARENLQNLERALLQQDWASIYHLCWDEFQDMHELFHTAEPAFSYMTAKTKDILQKLQEYWRHHGDGPIVTMDAGPNIHLLYRPDQKQQAIDFKHEYLGNYDVL